MIIKIAILLLIVYVLSPVHDRAKIKMNLKSLPLQIRTLWKAIKGWITKQLIKFDDWQRMI